MKFYIYAYNAGSNGARNLAKELGCKIIRHERSKYAPYSSHVLINWGAHSLPSWRVRPHILNKPESVDVNANKLSCFQLWNGKVSTPDWTTDKKVAASWKLDVVCRTLLTSHSGNGIIIVEAGKELPNAPLYTRYIKKDSEYRVHIVGGIVTDIQRKIRDPDREPTNWKVRSHANGFIYVRGNVAPPKSVVEEAQKAFKASGLDFGGIDVIVDRQGKAYCLEINTACGIENTTAVNYARAFKEMFK